MKRPTFFISSTIFDFADLRSSLKFFLEEMGCNVLASEFNDFRKPIDKHSYEACLQAIHSADYFILLVGTRVGGWYSEPDRVSITQREYREAYELHQRGKIKLITFVRSQVWQARQDRRALAKYLSSLALDDELKQSIANHSSATLSDAKFISSFLDEIARKQETLAAVRGEIAAPSGNWIHAFTSFRDMTDVLTQYVLTDAPIDDLAVKRLLRHDLRRLLATLLLKSGNGAVSPKFSIERLHLESPIEVSNGIKPTTTVSAKTWGLVATLSIRLISLRLYTTVLPHALTGSTFLAFDLQTNGYIETSEYRALLLLDDEIRKFNDLQDRNALKPLQHYLRPINRNNASTVSLDTVELAAAMTLLDRWVNIIDLCTCLLKTLDGKPFDIPPLRPLSPMKGLDADFEAEKVTDSDIDSFLDGFS